jgi:glycosyltransferase involved in cell wall biosynthesis
MRILFVAHEASRTGSPTVLRGLLGWLHAHTDVEIEVLVLKDGALREELTRFGPSAVLGPGVGMARSEMVEVGLRRTGLARASRVVRSGRARLGFRRSRRPDLVYVNSIPAAWVLDQLPWAGVPVVVHVHELDSALERMPAQDSAVLFSRTDLFVAASGAVEEMLCARAGVDPDRVVRRYEHIDPSRMPGPPPGADEPDPAQAVGVPAGAPVVLAAGTADWRKGPDLFVQLGVALRRDLGDRAPHLVWVGAPGGANEGWPPAMDIRSAGLEGQVHLAGETADLAPWLRRASVLVLTSREDPFPLVCLEAAWCGTPFVSFDNGGMGELAGDGDAGVIVGHLDVEAMATAVGDLLADDGRRAAMAEAARRRVLQRHVVDVVAPQIWADLQALAGTR